MPQSYRECPAVSVIFATLAALVLAAGATLSAAPAGDPLTPLEIAVACAPPPVLVDAATGTLRIVGSQDAVPRSLFGQPELLVVNGGTAQGIEIGQRYFVRRPVRTGSSAGYAGMASPQASKRPSQLARTSGWVRVVSLNETTSLVSVEHACSDIISGDYLAPFAVPSVAPDLASVDPSGELDFTSLDFTSLGRVLFGDEERSSGGIGDYMLIDRGEEQGVAAGARFAIYRDLQVDAVPLTAIGEATVVSTGPQLALVRINQARDAVFRGDYVVPRKR